MPVTDAIILSVIVTAFVAFALLLAWGDYQTRNIRPIVRPAARKVDNDRAPTKSTAVRTQAERKAA